MNCKEIIREYLIANHYAGLVGPACDCVLNDLMPCDSDAMRCEPGYEVEDCASGCGSYIASDRRKAQRRIIDDPAKHVRVWRRRFHERRKPNE